MHMYLSSSYLVVDVEPELATQKSETCRDQRNLFGYTRVMGFGAKKVSFVFLLDKKVTGGATTNALGHGKHMATRCLGPVLQVN